MSQPQVLRLFWFFHEIICSKKRKGDFVCNTYRDTTELVHVAAGEFVIYDSDMMNVS